MASTKTDLESIMTIRINLVLLLQVEKNVLKKKNFLILPSAGWKSKNGRASIYAITKLRTLEREVATISLVAQSNLYQGAGLFAGTCWLPARALQGSAL